MILRTFSVCVSTPLGTRWHGWIRAVVGGSVYKEEQSIGPCVAQGTGQGAAQAVRTELLPSLVLGRSGEVKACEERVT